MRAHLPEEREILIIQIQEQLNELKQLSRVDSHAIEGWEISVAGNNQPPGNPPKSGWKRIGAGTHWGDGQPDWTAWFRCKTQVPKRLVQSGSFVSLHLGIAREGLISINGKPFHGISENHKTFRITEASHLKKPLRIEVEAYTEAVQHPAPKYYGKFESAEFIRVDEAIDSLCWDLQVALDVLKTHDRKSTTFQRLLEVLASAMVRLQPYPEDLSVLRSLCRKTARWLKNELKQFPANPDDGRLLVCGHSHIDTAWLWPLQETKRKCGRTFSSILHLMEVNPEFTFAQGQPQLYQYVKEHYPEVYKGIKKRVAEGRWDPAGPAWVEMDCNLSGGEAIIRQFLYGNRFLEKEFGVRNNVCWLPDAFGYSWSLPQILKGCGVDFFVTTKIDWSMITTFPYTTFHWEGIDGTRIHAMMPPLNYNGNLIPKECKKQWEQIRQKDVLDEIAFSFGWGDGGGGPTQEMIENGKRLDDIAGIPKVRFGRLTDYFNEQREKIDSASLPVWNGELYLELHRACQITQARTKWYNRKMEVLLRETEFLSALGCVFGSAYPREELESIWRDVMTNQFHDILPGSSVEALYRETDEIYRSAMSRSMALKTKALDNYLKKIDTTGPGRPLVVFNSQGWNRTDPVGLPKAELKLKADEIVVDCDGDLVPSQVSRDLSGEDRVWIAPSGVPSVGHSTLRIVKNRSSLAIENSLKVSESRIENPFFVVELDPKGFIRRLYDKRANREVLPKGERSNILRVFHDLPHMHDAWDYDFNVDSNAWDWEDVQSIGIAESGPVRASIEIVRRTQRSTLKQRMVLYSNVPRIDFETSVDWWEKHVLLKAVFPVNIRSPKATYEIQFGSIERATHENTPFDRARFEVPHHRWMDLSEGNYGVAIANDSKYGSDILGNVMRLSLLRAPVHPDPHADEGRHEFVYSLIPHSGDWRHGNVVPLAAELNAPMTVGMPKKSLGPLPSTNSWLETSSKNLMIETLKREEDGKRLVLRVYECEGNRGVGTVLTRMPVKKAWASNLVERNLTPLKTSKGKINLDVTPYSVHTLMLELE
ncbi:MAG: alpha-mannosidase [Candidatus Omnitrophica bacterium]|nr:alpha-mannosidase [Candidatus Omnitrophota bacterium]